MKTILKALVIMSILLMTLGGAAEAAYPWGGNWNSYTFYDYPDFAYNTWNPNTGWFYSYLYGPDVTLSWYQGVVNPFW
jgi:hypothetical protein